MSHSLSIQIAEFSGYHRCASMAIGYWATSIVLLEQARMIQIMPESSGNVLGVKASGKLTHDEYRQILIPRLERLFRQHGKLNVLFLMDANFEGWKLDAAWDDASYGLRHNADFGKLAVVGGPAWVEWCIKLAGFLMKGEIRVFSPQQIEEAWDWVGQ